MSEEREQYVTAPAALDLDAIERRANAATPGPWLIISAGDDTEGVIAVPDPEYSDTGYYYICVTYLSTARNDVFIAAARTDVPALVAEVRRIRGDIERIGRERDQMIAANVELQQRLSRLEDDLK